MRAKMFVQECARIACLCIDGRLRLLPRDEVLQRLLCRHGKRRGVARGGGQRASRERASESIGDGDPYETERKRERRDREGGSEGRGGQEYERIRSKRKKIGFIGETRA